MKIFILSYLFVVSASVLGQVHQGNICTVALFDRDSDLLGSAIPGKTLGTAVSVDFSGTSSTVGKLYSVSKKRAVIYRGVIDMAGLFRTSFEEVDQAKDGSVTFKNPTILLEEKYYYSPYQELPADNKPAYIVMKDYVATIFCYQYKN
ncbi:MAG: hypothetical protein QE271_10540 [Bacteriovoracaceae bacterium]|nr:hypothetical protein [Bacteriovoracaceae bacterium]